jgi:CubicO group peptidase (beta-lactamase class C family)
MLKRILIISLSILFIYCGKKPDEKNESTLKDKDGNVSEFAVNFTPLSTVYKKKMADDIEYFYNKKFNSKDFSGGFLVAKNGEILYENYSGFAYKEKRDSIKKDTPIHLASVSKVITAVTVLKLVDQDKIELDELVTEYLPEFPHKQTTVRMLLNHRSGLRNYAYFTDNKKVWNKNKNLTNQDVLTLLATKNIGLESTPGTRFGYCNTNYALLALIIEKVTEKSYPKVLQEMIFDPLGMKNTFVFDDLKNKDNICQSYKNNYLRLAFEFLDQVYGDKNIYSTPRDLLKFDLALYSEDFLSKKMKSEMFKGYSYERKGTKNYGLGIRMLEFETGQHYYFHNGWWHGNTSSYVTLQKDSVTIIAISNKFSKKPYQTKRLAPIFGDYPFEFNDSEGE